MFFNVQKSLVARFSIILTLLVGMLSAIPAQAAQKSMRMPASSNQSVSTNTALIFEPYVNFPVGSGKAVGIGDFNSDGISDVAITTSTQLMVFLQNQDGSLASPTAYSAGSRPEALAVGDVNDDAKLDIVAANYDSNTISVFLQQVDGSFAARAIYPTSSGPDAVAIGDVNNDGLADIAVSHWTAANIGVFTQAAGGILNPMVTYPSPQAGYDDIAIADINHDGKNDVIKMNGQGFNPNLSIYLQNENDTLGSALSYSVTNCESFCLSHGIGTGDVTGDGLTDIAISYGGNRSTSKVAVFAQSPDGSLQSPVAYNAYDLPEPVEVADMNSDGRADVLVAHDGWKALSIFAQSNSGTLNDYSLYALPFGNYRSQGLAVGDLNQDGLPDVAIADSNNGLVLLYQTLIPPNTPTPTLTPTATFTLTPTITPITRTISGNAGAGSAFIYYEPPGDYVVSNSNGDYSLTVPLGWSGTVGASLPGYRFTPESRTYSNVQSDQANQDFVAEQVQTISGNAGVNWATLNYEENGILQTVTTSYDGSYWFQVPKHWSGTVTPSKTGYNFSPPARTYTDIADDQTGQDYVADRIRLTIAGNVGLSDVTLSYFDYYTGITDTVISNSLGDYAIVVPYNWHGYIEPFKTGYVFNPPGMNYGYVQTDLLDQNYTPQVAYVISGNVGVGGASLNYVDSVPKAVLADASGNYSLLVSEHWSGEITPYEPNYAFSPSIRSYSDVQADESGQDYTAIPLYTISGNVSQANVIISYVEDGELKTVLSDNIGNYSLRVKSGWSGTVTPSKVGVFFEPPSKDYLNVQSNQTAQDYKASIPVTTLADSGPGSLRNAIASAVSGDVISFHPDLAGQTITLASPLNIDKGVTINGDGLNPRVAISGNGNVQIFGVDPRYELNGSREVKFKSLLLKNGKGAMRIGGGNILIEHVSFVDNTAYDGGAIYSCCYNTSIKIIHSDFNSNSAQHFGGAIATQFGSLTVQDTTFTNNIAVSMGGAISIERQGPYTFEDNTFTNNNGLSGGALRFESVESPVIVRRNLFSGNHASSNGGAMFESLAYSSASFALENNTFYSNEAGDSTGAVLIDDKASLLNNTFSQNTAAQKGASLYIGYHANVTLRNNIFANGVGTSECFRYNSGYNFVSGDHNLVEDGSLACMPSIVDDPLLDSLADNGGSVQTMSLLPGSPAIDAGDNASCPSTDQRGVARPQGSGCDMGSFEYVPPQPPTPTSTPTATITNTPTPTLTNTPTITITPTLTYTPTATPTSTYTPTTTATPTQPPKNGKPPAPTKTPLPTRTPRK